VGTGPPALHCQGSGDCLLALPWAQDPFASQLQLVRPLPGSYVPKLYRSAAAALPLAAPCSGQFVCIADTHQEAQALKPQAEACLQVGLQAQPSVGVA
jgi:hypothetical protein